MIPHEEIKFKLIWYRLKKIRAIIWCLFYPLFPTMIRVKMATLFKGIRLPKLRQVCGCPLNEIDPFQRLFGFSVLTDFTFSSASPPNHPRIPPDLLWIPSPVPYARFTPPFAPNCTVTSNAEVRVNTGGPFAVQLVSCPAGT